MFKHRTTRSVARYLKNAAAGALALAVAAVGSLSGANADASASCPAPVITSMTPAEMPAAGGVLMTILGSNFLAGGSAKVQIGMRLVSIVSMTDQQIVVVVPPQDDEAEPQVRIIKPPSPNMSTVHRIMYAPPIVLAAPSAGAQRAGGTLITIHGSNFTCSAPGAYLQMPSGSTCPARVVSLTDTTVVVELGDCDDGDTGAVLHVTHVHKGGVIHRDLACRNILLEGVRAPVLSSNSGPASGGTLLTLLGSGFMGTSGAPPSVHVCMSGACREALVLSSSDTQIEMLTPTCVAGVPGHYAAKVRVVVDGIEGAGASFDYDATPVLRSVQGVSLPVAGGYPLTIRGENFAPGASVRVGGIAGGVIAAIVVSAGKLTCVSPPFTEGVTTIQVVQDGLLSSALPIEMLSPPSITTVVPAAMGAEGGVLLTVTGNNFGPPSAFENVRVQVKQAGHPPVDCGPVKWMAPEMLRCRVPEGVSGPAGVIVTVNGVAVTRPDAFVYMPLGPPSAPQIASISPPQAARLGGILMTVTGNNFVGASGNAQVQFGQSVVAPLSVSPTQIVFIQPPLADDMDGAPVEVVMEAAFSNPLYVEADNSAVNPLSSSSAGGWSGGPLMTITGNNFGGGARLHCESTTGEVHEVSPLSRTGNALVFTAPEFAPGGTVSVRVVEGSTQSNAQPMDYSGPEISSLSVTDLSSGGGTVITINGSNFGPAGAAVTVGGRQIHLSQYMGTSLEINCPPRPPGAAFLEPLRVISAAGLVSKEIPVRWAAPELNSLSAPAAADGGGTVVTIRGRDFPPQAFLEWGDGLPGPSLTVVDRSPAQFSVLLGAGSAGQRLVRLDTDSAPASATAPLELLAPPSLMTSSPPSGPLAGGNLLTVTGSNFGPAGTARSVHFAGADDCPMSVLSESPAQLVCEVRAGSNTGLRDLVVEVDGVADTLHDAYEYGGTTGVPVQVSAGASLALAALRSPFARELTLRLTLPKSGHWQLQLFDARGAHVQRFEGDATVGTFDVRWNGRAADGRSAPPGIYFARLTSSGVTRDARAVKLN